MKIDQVKNIRQGDRASFSFVGVLRNVQVRPTKTGGEFLALDFSDNTGTLSMTVFSDSPVYDVFLEANAGDVYRVYAMPNFYQGKLSPRADAAVKLTEDEIKPLLCDLAEVSPYNVESLKKELFDIVETISEEALRNTVLSALSEAGDDFFTSTAAVKMHHAYVHGLLEHSVKVARLTDNLCRLYPFIDRNLAIAGAVLHDIGKVLEYSQTLAPDRTRIGILQGHVVLGYRFIHRAAIKNSLDSQTAERLEHIILSHQGELEWGAAALAATPEAVLVSLADNLDAKMGAVEKALRGTTSEFTDFIPALKTKILTTKRDAPSEGEDVK